MTPPSSSTLVVIQFIAAVTFNEFWLNAALFLQNDTSSDYEESIEISDNFNFKMIGPGFRPPPDTNLSGLERLIQNHEAICWLDNNCAPSDQGSCCQECSCEPDCTKFGTCCPDVLEDFDTVSNPEVSFQCVQLSYPGHIIRFDNSELIVGECPRSLKESADTKNVIQKCKVRYGTPDLIDILPVDDSFTHITYANKHCAECHGVLEKDRVYWSAAIECKNSTFTPTSYQTLLSEINGTRDCDVILKPAGGYIKKPCKELINSCNVNGDFDNYDNFTEQACKLYFSPYMERFRNPFCALCNGYDVNSTKCDHRGKEGSGLGGVSFSALLDYRPAETVVDVPILLGGDQCTENQLYDPVSVSSAHKIRDIGWLITLQHTEGLSKRKKLKFIQFSQF